MNLQLDGALITELDAPTRKSLTTATTDAVGRVFHESLLRSLIKKNEIEGTTFAVTDKRVMTASLNFEDHEDRRTAAREAGRVFSVNAVELEETLLFIGATSVGINRDDDSEVAITFIQDLRPMHSVTEESEFVPAFKSSEIKLFLDELSTSGRITTVNDGDLCIPYEEYQALSEDEREGFTTAQNSLLFETFIGSTYAFKYYRDKAEAVNAAAAS